MKVRAPFSYWGSKTRMARWIVERLPEHDHFVEACGGSGAVMAVKEPVDAETLNDVYGEVVNFFRVLRSPEHSERLIDRVALTPYSLREFRDALAVNVNDPDPVRRAHAFVVRMQMAVVPGRTGWSYGATGAAAKKANKPGRWATMPELLKLCAQRFERVQITDWDVLDLIDRLDKPGVCIFVDPPYAEDSRPASTGGSSAYVHDLFDHEAFVRAVLEAKHASFAISHYPHPLYDAAIPTWDDFASHRNAPNGNGRDVKTERLYIVNRNTGALSNAA